MTTRIALALLATFAVAPVAHAKVYDVPDALGAELGKVARATPVAVRVPRTLELTYDGEVFASGEGSRREWSLSLAGAPGCGGATACFMATFSGERGGTPAFRRTVRLANGVTGYYKPVTCGASCSPAMLQWKQRGVLFSIQAKVPNRAALVRSANSAIRSSPR